MTRATPHRNRKTGAIVRPRTHRERCHGDATRGVDTEGSAFGGSRKNDEMTLKIARSNDTPRSPEAKTTPQNGWDPLEVWRTRVLLPRLAEAAGAEAEKESKTPSAVHLVTRKR